MSLCVEDLPFLNELRPGDQLRGIVESYPAWLELADGQLVVARGRERSSYPLGQGGVVELVTARFRDDRFRTGAGQALALRDASGRIHAHLCFVNLGGATHMWCRQEVHDFVTRANLDYEDLGDFVGVAKASRALDVDITSTTDPQGSDRVLGRLRTVQRVSLVVAVSAGFLCMFLHPGPGAAGAGIAVLGTVGVASIMLLRARVISQEFTGAPACPESRLTADLVVGDPPPCSNWVGVDGGLWLGLFLDWAAVAIVAGLYVATLPTLGITTIVIVVSVAPLFVLNAWRLRRTP